MGVGVLVAVSRAHAQASPSICLEYLIYAVDQYKKPGVINTVHAAQIAWAVSTVCRWFGRMHGF